MDPVTSGLNVQQRKKKKSNVDEQTAAVGQFHWQKGAAGGFSHPVSQADSSRGGRINLCDWQKILNQRKTETKIN